MKELLRAGLIHRIKEGQCLKYEVRRETVTAYTNELARRLRND
jgi:hypothetical protein